MARRQPDLYKVNPIVREPEILQTQTNAGHTYESKLNNNTTWALMEGSRHFDESSAVFETLRGIALRLNQLGIPYAIVGGMALFRHGFRRFTEDVDILISKDDLKRIHAELDGRGYVPPHRFSKNLRDTAHNVKIEFLLSGEFPGDGRPKPVAFPDPQGVNFLDDGISYLNLSNLIELKLASGMTQPDRIKDLGDVQQLIQILNLGTEYGDQLNSYVRDKYMELCKSGKKRFVTAIRNRWSVTASSSVEDVEKAKLDAANTLKSMLRDGVEESGTRSEPGDYVYMVTTDPLIAAKYDMVEESEYWLQDADPDSTN